MTIISNVDEWPRAALRPAVAVIGSGPAGVTVARDLQDRGIDVVMLESGSVTQTPHARELNDGEMTGDRFRFGRHDADLRDVRMRALGGSSGHWNGLCRPLEEYDLDDRPDIGRTGWPIERADLDTWCRKAHTTCGMGQYGYDAETWFSEFDGQSPVASDGLETVLYRFSPTRFGDRYRSDLENSKIVTLLLDATATDIVLSPDGQHVRRITASSSSGRSVEVEPDIVVLASGGIEAPRLLLATGTANSSGLVGRGFMEHPHVRLGRVALSGDFGDMALYQPIEGRGPFAGTLGWAGLSLKDHILREHSLLAGALTLEAPYDPGSPAGPDLVAGVAELLHDRPSTQFRFATLRTEQLSTPSHSVTLGSKRDALGQRLPNVHWTVDPETVRELQRLMQTIAVEFGRSGLGRVEMTETRIPLEPRHVEVGCHHMGTTRMSADPRSGVVDRDCFSHDHENLCVVGSSVFPTSGYANPTLTVVALAHRLAAEIARRLS